MSLIFEYSFKPGSDPAELYGLAVECGRFPDDEYVRSTFCGICGKLDFIDGKISEYSNGWKTSRISPVALAIMRTAVYEIYFREDVPPASAVNEAIELVKEYDDEKKIRPFVNGILNSILHDPDLGRDNG